jgi:hypothetical protein
MTLRRFAVWFLAAEAVGAVVWWAALLGWPVARTPFLARGAPDVTLLAFVVADLGLYAGTAAAAAVGLRAGRTWAWLVLVAHAAAAGYAGLYCWTLTALTGGDGLLGAILMTPSLVVPGWLVVGLRPGGRPC